MKVKSWLRLCRGMSTINSVVRGLHLKGKIAVTRMKKVSLSIVVYLIWEERNIRVFENSCSLVESIFQRFQVLFHMILHFYKQNHLRTNFRWLVWWLLWLSSFVESCFPLVWCTCDVLHLLFAADASSEVSLLICMLSPFFGFWSDHQLVLRANGFFWCPIVIFFALC
jgi:hypothetical protein